MILLIVIVVIDHFQWYAIMVGILVNSEKACGFSKLNIGASIVLERYSNNSSTRIGETGAHWDKNQLLGPRLNNVNLTTSDT